MTDYVTKSGLSVHPLLVDFVEKEALPGLSVTAEQFWSGFAALVAEHAPTNARLLAKRDTLQSQIDEWHHQNGPVAKDPACYEAFLREIGYLVAEPADFSIETAGLDPEITTLCGPQLVVPVSNARYALNAANARWGSLYDVLYGTDVIDRTGDLAPGSSFNAMRGAAVVERAAAILDDILPLTTGSHREVTAYVVAEQAGLANFVIDTRDGPATLQDAEAFVGYAHSGDKGEIVLRHHGLHVILVIDKSHPIGANHPAGLADVIVESALTTIQDCEDSVAAVDAEDKVGVYRNWLGLMNGTLEDTFEKNGRSMTRRLRPDRHYTDRDGKPVALSGGTVEFKRPVGDVHDTRAALAVREAGVLGANIDLADGAWVMEINADAGLEDPYRHIVRILIKNGKLL